MQSIDGAVPFYRAWRGLLKLSTYNYDSFPLIFYCSPYPFKPHHTRLDSSHSLKAHFTNTEGYLSVYHIHLDTSSSIRFLRLFFNFNLTSQHVGRLQTLRLRPIQRRCCCLCNHLRHHDSPSYVSDDSEAVMVLHTLHYRRIM